MGKKILFVFILLAFLAGAYAQETTSTALVNTKLLVFLEIIEEKEHSFIALAHIINIGPYHSYQTKVSLENVPADWKVTPESPQDLGFVSPNQDKYAAFFIEKGETDATIYATAWAENAPLVSSQVIPVPVFFATSVAIAGAIGAMVVSRKKK